ncbi:putative IBR domain, E3 ubiquitin ligase RBR family [Rosa chinensis]|uniref:RBR-type E3 ubiquitin transferase n=1 Tax=Rosa chinensis TaxID=74649 RepID=A0A2P6RL11_ROSCH|nr:putative IBR domain, E3 ubiquitin ligase RBR family [Rosa chinensis]
MCEAVILGSQKFYCPFKDCSAMLIDDGAEVVRDSECPNCNRMFCAQCKVPWHAGIECAEFKKLKNDEKGNEDIMLRNLAQKNQWRRCPKSRFYVEKLIGCDTMRCRCAQKFSSWNVLWWILRKGKSRGRILQAITGREEADLLSDYLIKILIVSHG